MRRSLNILLIICLLAVGGCSFTSSSPPIAEKSEKQVINNSLSADLSKQNKEDNNQEDSEKAKLKEDEKKADEKADDEQGKFHKNGLASEPTNTKEIKLLLTQDFGREIIFNKSLPFTENDDLLKLMQENLDIDTNYGGSFISSINGLKMKSGAKRSDWFFYINGILSHTGLRDYRLTQNDKIMWDYHLWSVGPTNNAIIGLYPAPFTSGYRGSNKSTIIIHDELSQKLAENLAFSLKNMGVKVNTSLINDTAIKEQPTIIIGKWTNLADNETLNNLNKAYQKNGLGVHLTKDGLELLDYKGQAARNVTGSAAVIAAWGRSIGDANPLWLIVGTDEVALSKAVNILINSPADIQGLYGVAVLPEGNIPLPLK